MTRSTRTVPVDVSVPARPDPARERKRPLRVLHLLKHARRGNGSVHVAVDLACAQADAGMDVRFASGPGSYDELLSAHGVEVIELEEPLGVPGLIRSAGKVGALVRRVDPDIVHAHMMSSAVAAWPVSKASSTTLVTTMHNSFDRHSWMMRAGARVVAVSEAEARLLRSRGYPAKKLRVVLNGAVGSARESLTDTTVPDLRLPAVATLSGLHPRKGIDDVIAAFELLAQDFPEWHLNVIGWGPAQADLEAQVAEAGLTEVVHFLGPTMTPWRQLAQAQIFVTASLAEPFGLNVAEARAAGCAVVATDVGGIPEVLDGGEAGQLVPARDPRALADALRPLMADPAELRRWRARALAGSERFSVAEAERGYAAVYLEAMPRRRRRRLDGGARDRSAEARGHTGA